MRYTALALLLYYSFTLFPKPIKNYEIVSMPELTISFEKTSLSIAAIKDSQIQKIQSIAFQKNVEYESLEIESAEKELSLSQGFVNEGPIEVNFEKGMTLKKDDILFVSQVQKSIKDRKDLQEYAQQLSSGQYNRLILSGIAKDEMKRNWQQDALYKKAKRLVAKELEKRKENRHLASVEEEGAPWNPIENSLNKEKNNYLIVSPKKQNKRNLIASLGNWGSKASPAPSTGASRPKNPKGSAASTGSTGEDTAFASSYKEKENDTEVGKSHVLRGNFEFVKGVAYFYGEHDFRIYHEYEAQVLSEGQVNWSKGSFEIATNHLKGELVANIQDREGFIIAEARIPLEGLPQKEYELSGFFMALEPYYNGFHIQTISSYSFDSYIKEQANVYFDYPKTKALLKSDEKGRYQNRWAKNGSTANYQFQSEGNWSTTKHVEGGAREDVAIFDDSMVEALIEILKDEGMNADPYQNGIVWGKVKTNKKSGAGAVIRLSDKKAFGPAYLNRAYLPDTHLMATTKNGYFIFIGVEPGMHSIEILHEGKRSAKAIETFKSNISYIEIDLTEHVEQKLSILEMDQNLEGEIESYIVGNSDTNIIQTNPMKVRSTQAASINLFEFRKKEGLFTYRSHLPQIAKDLSLRILPEKKLDGHFKRYGWHNAIIGFINPSEYAAAFLNKEDIEDQMYYFDYKGDIISRDEIKLKWEQVAGYVLADIPEGAHHFQVFSNNGYYTSHYISVAKDLVYLIPEIN